jgi:hypothetical protein
MYHLDQVETGLLIFKIKYFSCIPSHAWKGNLTAIGVEYLEVSEFSFDPYFFYGWIGIDFEGVFRD